MQYQNIPGTDLSFRRDPPFSSSWLQGEIQVPFSKVVEVFGEPGPGDNHKVAFEWDIEFGDGTRATIYDYKESNLYDDDLPSPEALRKADFADWYVGGTSDRALELVERALGVGT